MGRGKSITEDQQQKIREKIDQLWNGSQKDYTDEAVAAALKKDGIEIAASGVAGIRRKMKLRKIGQEGEAEKPAAAGKKRGPRAKRSPKPAQTKPAPKKTGEKVTLDEVKEAMMNVFSLVERYAEQQAEKEQRLREALS